MVAVRLGLPLLSTDVKKRRMVVNDPSMRTVEGGISNGQTTLEREKGWKHWAPGERPDAAMRADYELRAAQTAAGIVAEGSAEPIGARMDLEDVMQFWAIIEGRAGEPITPADPPAGLAAFIVAATERARLALEQDGRVAWDRVTVALGRKPSLTGDQVRKIIGELTATDAAS